MNSINLKILVYYLLFLYLSVTFVSASESNKNSEIENVISAQLKAFKAKDIYEAYSFASPKIKRRYPSPEIFDQMVKTSFNDIWNPKQYLFKSVKQMDDVAYQEVLVFSQSDIATDYLYSLSKYNGKWLITGVSSYIPKDIGI